MGSSLNLVDHLAQLGADVIRTAGTTDINAAAAARRTADVDIAVAVAIPVVLAWIGDDRSRGPRHPVRTADLALRTYGGPTDAIAVGPRRGCGDDDSEGSHRQSQSQYQAALSQSHGCSLSRTGRAQAASAPSRSPPRDRGIDGLRRRYAMTGAYHEITIGSRLGALQPEAK